MTAAPLPPGSRPGGAAEIETGLEQPVNRDFLPKSQALARLRRQRHVEQVHRLGARLESALGHLHEAESGVGDHPDVLLHHFHVLGVALEDARDGLASGPGCAS